MDIPALAALQDLFGNIDIYFFDQLLKGRILANTKVLDAGCGNGRNIKYLMQAGCHIYGADQSVAAIEEVRQLAAAVAPGLPPANFAVADLNALPYTAATFEVVLCSAVLHFARNETHFREMVQELWRVLQPGGMLFCRLSTTIGLQDKLQPQHNGKYQMPHGAVWFLADELLLIDLEKQLGSRRLEPLKTVLVEQQRAMSTWVLQKPNRAGILQ